MASLAIRQIDCAFIIGYLLIFQGEINLQISSNDMLLSKSKVWQLSCDFVHRTDEQRYRQKPLFAVCSLNRDFVPTNRPTDSKNCSFSIRLSI